MQYLDDLMRGIWTELGSKQEKVLEDLFGKDAPLEGFTKLFVIEQYPPEITVQNPENSPHGVVLGYQQRFSIRYKTNEEMEAEIALRTRSNESGDSEV